MTLVIPVSKSGSWLLWLLMTLVKPYVATRWHSRSMSDGLSALQGLGSPPAVSVAECSPTLCDPTNCSTPGFSVNHYLPELAQTHVHRVGDAIQPSHPLSSPSPAFNLSQ